MHIIVHRRLAVCFCGEFHTSSTAGRFVVAMAEEEDVSLL